MAGQQSSNRRVPTTSCTSAGLRSRRHMTLTRDAILAFMKGQTGAVCASCIAKALRLSFDRTVVLHITHYVV